MIFKGRMSILSRKVAACQFVRKCVLFYESFTCKVISLYFSNFLLQAEFFNSYLSDPRRPQVPEGPTAQRPPGGNHVGQMYGHQPGGGGGAQSMMGWGPRPQMMMYGE